MSTELWIWTGHALERVNDTSEQPLLVADSWLTVDGSTRALDRHRLRFLSSALSVDASVTEKSATGFWDAAMARIPETGEWFPRVEQWSGRAAPGQPTRRGEPAPPPTLALRLRPAPDRSDSVVLATAHSDPRLVPALKGPDISRLLALRAEARAVGADESVILSPDGHVVDGTTSALFWWRDGELFEPPASLARVDSVTAQVIKAVARAAGVRYRRELAAPADLDRLEIWTANALHGLRPVTGWIGGPTPAPPSARVGEWRAMLDDPRYAS